jgi:peroxiredoxin
MSTNRKILIIISIVLSVALLFFCYKYILSDQDNKNAISIKVKGIQNKQAYLSLLKGGKKVIIDTANIEGEEIYFQFDKPIQIGMYRVILDEKNYIDLVFDNKTVEMSTDIDDLVSKMKVSRSEENKQYYEYLKFSQLKNLKIFDIVAEAKVLRADTVKNAKKIESLKKEIDNIVVEKNKYIADLSARNPNSLTSRIIRSYILPDFEEFKRKNSQTTYKDKNEFLGDHFFDYINFNDTMLLYTDVFFNACNNYIRNFVSADGDGYRKAIDVVMSKSAASPKVNKYFLDLFVETFEESSWEGVFTYLVDKYYLQSYCESEDSKAKDLKNKTEVLKNLAIGNKAPEIKLKNNNDKSISMYSLKGNYFLLFFWKSSCEYCEESIPELKNLYSTYKRDGFEIIAISIDTVKTTWVDAIRKNEMKWINLCDFQGYKSPVSKSYYVWRTPTFYLLDKDKKIISKPVSVDQIRSKLEKVYGYITIDKDTK